MASYIQILCFSTLNLIPLACKHPAPPSGVARGGAAAPGRRPEGGAKILPKSF